jgi:hypothetical protein
LQIEKLIGDAKEKDYLPFYCYYYTGKNTSQCQRYANINNIGIYLAGASKLYEVFIKKGATNASANDLLKYANPFHCIVCCSISEGNTVESIYLYLKNISLLNCNQKIPIILTHVYIKKFLIIYKNF